MAAAEPKAVDHSVDEHDRVERLLADFDHDWADGQFASFVGRLPAAGQPLRASALLALIRMEIERQWQQGSQTQLETYLERCPELGTRDSVPISLILQEYRARRRFGAVPDLDEFARRFPRQADELRKLLGGEANTEVKPDSARRIASPAFLSPNPPSDSASTSGQKGDDGPSLPEQFDRYRILKKLGQGGMGAVYLAHDTKLDRRVALKVPKFRPDSDPENLERFYREARATATIHHPNLCPLHDVGEHDGMPYLTMAYIEGWPLSHFIRPDKRLPQSGIAALVRTIALAIAEAHKLGIVHRDLKPGNVLVDKRGQPIVMDFGLARWVNADKDDVRLTKSGAILGAPVYMSPEQVYGDVENMGPSCDIYSLGVILYELLTARLPFEGGTTAVLAKTLMQTPAPPSKYRTDLDPRLEAICLKSMAKQIHERYATMTEMACALGEYLRADRQEREGSGSGISQPGSGKLKGSQSSADSAARSPSSVEPKPAVVAPRPSQPLQQDKPTPAPTGRETLAQGPPSDIKKPSPKAVIAAAENDTSQLAGAAVAFRRVASKPPPLLKQIRRTHRKAWIIGGSVALFVVVAALATWLLWPAPPSGSVQFRLRPTDADVSVELDNRILDVQLLATPLELKPGMHTLTVTGTGYLPFRQEFNVREGDTRTIDVEMKPIPVMRPKLNPQPEPRRPKP